MLKMMMTGAALTLSIAAAAQDPAAPQSSAAATDSEFAAFDVDRSGKLDQNEFSTWYRAKAEQQLTEAGQSTSPDELEGQATLAFNQADLDQDKVVTRQELSRFLVG